MTKNSCFLFLLLILFFQQSYAQVAKTDALYKTILAKDSLLFSVGFNTCDIKQYEVLLSDNLKFYHDKDGISDRTKFLRDLKNGLCKSPETRQVKRVLVKESTEIFPLYKNNVLYGAIQNGEHLFYENPENKPGAAKFTNVWMLENGEWKLTTSLSFDHKSNQTQKIENSIFNNDTEIESLLKESNIQTLGIGVIDGGKLKEIKVFGEIDKGATAPYNTIFNVASLTKPVTALVALRLVSLGKWNLEEPLYKYWTDPDVVNDPRNRKLTTRIILSHQTGFPNWRWMNKDNKLNFEFEPGTKFQYSGEGFEYLRKALENKFKKPLQQLASELIFEPLKMEDTDYIWNKSTDETRFAIGYDKNAKPYETIKNKTANGADDLHTTIRDYGNFLVSILNGGNLSESVYQKMVKKQVQTGKNKYFGLGFVIYDLGEGEYAISHDGSDSGTNCLIVLLPKTKQGILIFTNSDAGYKTYDKLLVHYLDQKGKKIVEIETK